MWPLTTAIVSGNHAFDSERFQSAFRQISFRLICEDAERNEFGIRHLETVLP
jgi:hypothetical protein